MDFALVGSTGDQWLVIGFAIVNSLLFGGIAGWWLAITLRPSSGLSPEQADVFLQQLHGLTQELSADVSRHQHKVSSINKDLTSMPTTGGEVGEMVIRALTQAVAANEKLQAQLNTAETRLEAQADQIGSNLGVSCDSLTGLPGRRGHLEELEARFGGWTSSGEPCSLLVIEINHYQGLIDLHGRAAVETLIKAVARLLAGQIGPQHILARPAPERFAVTMSNTSLSNAKAVAERIQNTLLTSRFRVDHATIRLPVSAGLSATIPGDEIVNDFVQRVEAAVEASAEDAGTSFHAACGESIAALNDQPPPVHEEVLQC